MERHHSKLKKLDQLLPYTAKELGLDFRMKEMMVMNFWPEIAKGEIGKDSRPQSIVRSKKGITLYVGAKSAMAAQELNLVKMVLLDKINTLAVKIGITINEIVVSTKYWQDVNSTLSDKPMEIEDLQKIKDFKKEEIDSIVLTKQQEEFIETTLKDLNLEDALKEKLRNIMCNDIKIQTYKKGKGYPLCKSCGAILNNINKDICPACGF